MATESAAFALSAHPGLHWQRRDPAPRWLLPAVVAAHAALLAFLATLEVIPLPAPLATLMVRVIVPAPPPAAAVAPPRPAPAERKPAPRPQPAPAPEPHMLAAQPESPAAAEAPAVQEVPAPPPMPAPAPSVAAETPPRFDANYLDNPSPAYPALSRRLGEEGKVVLRVFVEPGGRPGRIEISTSSGSPRLDQAAQEAVRHWRFVPARRGEEAVGAWVRIPIVFNLRG